MTGLRLCLPTSHHHHTRLKFRPLVVPHDHESYVRVLRIKAHEDKYPVYRPLARIGEGDQMLQPHVDGMELSTRGAEVTEAKHAPET